MKGLFIITVFFLGFNKAMLAQTSHLSLIYDFDGADFDYSVRGMVGTNDSLYVISNTPNGRGIFFRIDENGDGYKVIWEFDEVNYGPFSIVGNDTVIYITTYNTPVLFKYSLRDYSFELVKVFNFSEVAGIAIKYITDSTLWLLSTLESEADKGNIFTTNSDGTNLKKIYQPKSTEQAQNPVDFFFHEGKIYIACWGGGNLCQNAGGSVYCGSFIRINADGTGYENIMPGSDEVGFAPQSLVIQGNKLYGLFAYSENWDARVFKSDLDGSSYEPLSSLTGRAFTRMLSTDSLIYGISTFNVFGINPSNGEIRIFDDLLSNPDFGYDVVSNPAFLNGHVFIAAQQGGPNSGGTILKWSNEPPDVHVTSVGNTNGTIPPINLAELFTDTNEDSLSHSFVYDADSIAITESNGILTITPLVNDQVEIKIITTDGWAGYNGARIKLNPFEITEYNPVAIITNVDEKVLDQKFRQFLFPNPTHSIMKLTTSNVESIQIFGLDGRVYESFLNPGDEIDISTLGNGVYFARGQINGAFHWQKIVKY